MAAVKSLALVVLFVAFNALMSESRVARMDRELRPDIDANVFLGGNGLLGSILGSETSPSSTSASGSSSRSGSSSVHSYTGNRVGSEARSSSSGAGSYVGSHEGSKAGSATSGVGSEASSYAGSHAGSGAKGDNGK